MNFSIALGTALLDLYVDYNKTILLPIFLRKNTFNEVIEKGLYSSLFSTFPKNENNALFFNFYREKFRRI
jgi:hypothetical protein